MNMDYTICNALNYRSEGFKDALVIYDVGCQWSVNFGERISQSTHLSLPRGLNVITAVGKFHLNAHVLECFSKFSLNFVHGAGQLDGEILETLWAGFNKVSVTARAMSKAHRREIYDDFMRDTNWKKAVGMC